MRLYLKGLMVTTLLYLPKRYFSKTVNVSVVPDRFLLEKSSRRIGKFQNEVHR
jgi:hypothetical protein